MATPIPTLKIKWIQLFHLSDKPITCLHHQKTKHLEFYSLLTLPLPLSFTSLKHMDPIDFYHFVRVWTDRFSFLGGI